MVCQAGFDPWLTTIMPQSVAFEQAPGHRVGPVELWEGTGALGGPERRQQPAGGGHAAQRTDGASTVTRRG